MIKQNIYDFIDDQETVIVIHDDVFPIYIIKGDKNFLVDTGTTAKAINFHTKCNGIIFDSCMCIAGPAIWWVAPHTFGSATTVK